MIEILSTLQHILAFAIAIIVIGILEGAWEHDNSIKATLKEEGEFHLVSWVLVLFTGVLWFPYKDSVMFKLPSTLDITLFAIIYWALYMVFHQGFYYLTRHYLNKKLTVYSNGFYSDASPSSTSWIDIHFPIFGKWLFRHICLMVAIVLTTFYIIFTFICGK